MRFERLNHQRTYDRFECEKVFECLNTRMVAPIAPMAVPDRGGGEGHHHRYYLRPLECLND